MVPGDRRSSFLLSKPLQVKVAGVHFLTGGSSKPGKTGVIAGAVVGGVASLAFLGLGIFLSALIKRTSGLSG